MKSTRSQNERLKSRKLIAAVFETGKRITTSHLRASYLFHGSSSPDRLQVGVTVSTKNFPRAVDRNRIKRVLREGWRLNKQPLKNMIEKDRQLLVFLMYGAKAIIDTGTIHAEISEVIQKISARLKQES